MLIRERNAKPRMDYLNSDSDVDIEPPCGPGELIFIVSFVPASPCAVCHRHLSDRFALYLKKGERKRSELKGKNCWYCLSGCCKTDDSRNQILLSVNVSHRVPIYHLRCCFSISKAWLFSLMAERFVWIPQLLLIVSGDEKFYWNWPVGFVVRVFLFRISLVLFGF